MNKILLSVMLLLVSGAVTAEQPATTDRLNEVAERGAHVMPFSLEKTLHIFNKTDNGGVQQVIAGNPADSQQISLIRKHLADIAARFAKGDFSGPKRIHGNDMPGVAELSAGVEQVHFNYQDLPNGGQIEYVAESSELVTAIHSYFDAQLRDHARHAVPGGHGMHHSQPQ